MEVDKNFKEQSQMLVDNLILIKDNYIKTMEQLNVSIRRDVVGTELKDIVANTSNYDELKEELNKYIEKLYKLEGGTNEK